MAKPRPPSWHWSAQKDPLSIRVAMGAGKFAAGALGGLLTGMCGLTRWYRPLWSIALWVLVCGFLGLFYGDRFFAWVNRRFEGDHWGE